MAPSSPRRDFVPWLYGLGFLILAAAILYLWQYPSVPAETAADISASRTIDQRLSDIHAHVTHLEQKQSATDSRLSRLEQQKSSDLQAIKTKLNAFDGRIADQKQLASRVDAISGRIESLSGRDQTALDKMKQQLDTMTSKIAALESNAANVTAVRKRLNRIASLQEASLALASGRPLGDLPDAPQALARFAHTAAPTEAQLRINFRSAEQAALAAKKPDEADAPFVDRVWNRAQGLITVRRGDEVVVGDPTATILTHAETALNAGDIAGAVNRVETLNGQPARAMAKWLTDAKALLGARSALADMADHA